MSTIIYGVGLLYVSACTNDTDKTATDYVNFVHPTGIPSRWEIADEPFANGQPNPCPCEDDPSRRHLLFSC